MKKLVSLLLVALLACTLAVPALATSDTLVMDTLLLDIFEMSGPEYVSTETNRGIFATMALLDAILTDDARANTICTEALSNDNIYVASGESIAVCFLFGEDTCLMIGYGDAMGAQGTFIEISGSLGSALVANLKDGGSISNYWKVPSATVLEWMQVVLDALES